MRNASVAVPSNRHAAAQCCHQPAYIIRDYVNRCQNKIAPKRARGEILVGKEQKNFFFPLSLLSHSRSAAALITFKLCELVDDEAK